MTLRETTVAASVVSDMLQYLAERGVHAGTASSALSTARALTADPRPHSPDERVPGSRIERLWTVAVSETGDALVGLHMGETYNAGPLDILGYVILSCRTVGDALRATRITFFETRSMPSTRQRPVSRASSGASPIAHLDQPIPSANPVLLQLFEQHADGALRSIEHEDSRKSQAVRVLATNLKGSVPGLDEVARESSMSTRNLQRTLRDAGTTYQSLLDEPRRDLAIPSWRAWPHVLTWVTEGRSRWFD